MKRELDGNTGTGREGAPTSPTMIFRTSCEDNQSRQCACKASAETLLATGRRTHKPYECFIVQLVRTTNAMEAPGTPVQRLCLQEAGTTIDYVFSDLVA